MNITQSLKSFILKRKIKKIFKNTSIDVMFEDMIDLREDQIKRIKMSIHDLNIDNDEIAQFFISMVEGYVDTFSTHTSGELYAKYKDLETKSIIEVYNLIIITRGDLFNDGIHNFIKGLDNGGTYEKWLEKTYW